jgi:acetate kinase
LTVLALNAGSSSLKFALFQSRPEGQETTLVRGIVERIGTPGAQIRFQAPAGRDSIPVGAADAAKAAETILRMTTEGKLAAGVNSLQAVGCRVVHGGANLTKPTRVTGDVLKAIRDLTPLAPLHNPIDADVLEAALKAVPDAAIVAVFDTAFHRTLPPEASTYALPRSLIEKHGLRRYGFHGIAHRYTSERVIEHLGRGAAGTHVITCHLGNGCSVCAIKDGRSVDTSMGLTPLEGLVMGTRCGDVDPGLLLYLQQREGLSADELDDTLNHKSGLAGLSNRSADMRDLEKAADEGDALAEEALKVFAYRVRKYIGAYAAALGGVDALAFSGGIGEHSARMRGMICQDLQFLGLELDAERNHSTVGDGMAKISREGSSTPIWAIPVDEELQIARETHSLLKMQTDR